MRNVGRLLGAAAVFTGALLAPALAHSQVEVRSSAPEQHKRFEIVAPPPAAREATRPPEADFYREDQRVPYEPAFIEPLVGTTKGGTKMGASGWTSPQTPVGSLASQIYQQNNGWFGFGFTFIWDAGPAPTPRSLTTPAPRPAAAPARPR
jgi:hypothetical protein